MQIRQQKKNIRWIISAITPEWAPPRFGKLRYRLYLCRSLTRVSRGLV